MIGVSGGGGGDGGEDGGDDGGGDAGGEGQHPHVPLHSRPISEASLQVHARAQCGEGAHQVVRTRQDETEQLLRVCAKGTRRRWQRARGERLADVDSHTAGWRRLHR